MQGDLKVSLGGHDRFAAPRLKLGLLQIEGVIHQPTKGTLVDRWLDVVVELALVEGHRTRLVERHSAVAALEDVFAHVVAVNNRCLANSNDPFSDAR